MGPKLKVTLSPPILPRERCRVRRGTAFGMKTPPGCAQTAEKVATRRRVTGGRLTAEQPLSNGILVNHVSLRTQRHEERQSYGGP